MGKIDKALLDIIVLKICQVSNPQKIILFGSYARGEEKEKSDIDIMVIQNSDKPRYKRSLPIRLALRGIIHSKDIVVYTSEEIKEWASASTSFVATVLREGKILYEAK